MRLIGRIMGVMLLTVLWALFLSPPSHAHGEIVYGARYYLPPGSQGTSHYHIYRIDPDGRNRVQLTFGNSDDLDPFWVSDGTRIEFYRQTVDSCDTVLMEMLGDGSGIHRMKQVAVALPFVQRVASSMGDEKNVSPNGAYVFKPSYSGDTGDIIDTASGKPIATIDSTFACVHWLSNAEFSAITESEDEAPVFENIVYDLHGKQRSCVTLNNITPPDSLRQQELSCAMEQYYATGYRPAPSGAGDYLVTMCALHGYSTLYWLRPRTNQICFLTGYYTLAWAPDEVSFAACPKAGTSPYQRRPDGTWRVVYTSPLVVVNAKTLSVRVLQGGLVCCAGCDWLGGKLTNPPEDTGL